MLFSMLFFPLERRGKNPSSLLFTGEILPTKIMNSKFKNEVIMGASIARSQEKQRK